MKCKNIFLLSVLLTLITTQKSFAQLTYYVDNKLYTGSPAGSGTITDPWTTLSQAIYWWDTSNLRTQDVTIIFRSGTYSFNNGEALYIPADWGGKNGYYFTLKAATGETVNFDGTNITSNFSSLAIIAGTDNIKLQGFTFKNLKNISGQALAINPGSSNVHILNCNFQDVQWTSDAVEAGYPSSANNMSAILIDGRGTSVSGVTLDGNSFSNLAPGYSNVIQTYGTVSSLSETNSSYTSIVDRSGSYYVSTTGNDATGSGSIAKPWRTPRYAITVAGMDYSVSPGKQINKAVTLYFRGGTYKPDTLINIGATRASGQWFNLKNYPGETAILDGSDLVLKFSALLSIADAKNIKVEGLRFTKLTNNAALDTYTIVSGDTVWSRDTRFGIIVSGNSDFISIRKNQFDDLKWTRDTTKAKYPSPSHNLGAITILGTTDSALTNVVIDSNVVYNIVPGYTEAITVNGNVDTFSITNNLVHDIANIGIVAAGNYKWIVNDPNYTVTTPYNFSKHGLIKNNEVYKCISPIAVSAGIYLDGSRFVTVEDNESYHNGAGISIGNEQDSSVSGWHMIRSNVFRENLTAGVYYGSTNHTSIVDSTTVKWNTIKDNFYIDAALRQKANNMYGVANTADKYVEVQVARLKNSVFEENEIESESNIIMGFFQYQSGLTFRYNEYYNISEDDCEATFIRHLDAVNGNTIDTAYTVMPSFHAYVKHTGYDATSECEGEEYDPNGCGTSGMMAKTSPVKINVFDNVTVYPNPAVHDINVRLKLKQAGQVRIELVNTSGRVVLTKQLNVAAGIQDIKLTGLQQYGKGIYMLRASSANETATFKVLIQ